MTRMNYFRKMLCASMTLALISGCNGITEEAKDIARAAKRSQHETREAWREVLTYTPQPEAPLSQRRFCYRRMGDIVCYDSEQNTTSPLVAIQEGIPGRMVTGMEMGGRAMGSASADMQVSTVQPPVSHAAPASQGMGEDAPIMGVVEQSDLAAPSRANTAPLHTACGAGTPFPCKESPYAKDKK